MWLFLVLFYLVEDYVEQLTDAKGIGDKLSKRNFTSDISEKDATYPSHLTPAQIHDGIKNGQLIQGSFQASRENYLEGQVNTEKFEKPVSVNATSTQMEKQLVKKIKWIPCLGLKFWDDHSKFCNSKSI